MSSKKRMMKIKTEAKATPVASFRERYRDRSKHTTLTQLLGSSDSDTVNFVDNRKRSAKRTPSPKSKKRKKNVDLFESSAESDSESDTVTATIVTPPKKYSSRKIKRTMQIKEMHSLVIS